MNEIHLVTPITYQNTDADLVDPEFKKYAQLVSYYVNRRDYTLVIGKNKTNPKFFLALRRRVNHEGRDRYVVQTLAFDDFIQSSEELARYSAAYLLDGISTTLHNADEKHKMN